MELVSVGKLRPGHTLAKHVVVRGNVLLKSGTSLSNVFIEQLKKLSVNYVHVQLESIGAEKTCIADKDEQVAYYSKKSQDYNPSRDKPETLYEIMDALADIGTRKAASVLEYMLRIRDTRIPGDDLAVRIFDSILRMPTESLTSNLFLVQMRMFRFPRVIEKCIAGITLVKDPDSLYPLLLGTKHIPLECLPGVTAFAKTFDAPVLMRIAIKSLTESDAAAKNTILSVLKDAVTPEHYALLLRIPPKQG
ncbi:MAG: hypothetical protein PHQ23_14135 [Candidatus Wallbacteria bacterium]|nr:hypothetical protein [Candidatus Wallbacteria bacterium]